MGVVLLLIGCIGLSCNTAGTQMRLDAEGALQDLKQVRTAEQEYHIRNGRWATLSELVDADFLDGEFSDGSKGAYIFSIGVDGSSYEVSRLRKNSDLREFFFSPA
jgi:hypothetical protein